MTTTLRETENHCLVQDTYGNTAVCSKLTGCQTTWKVGVDVRDEINHIKHLSDTEFDEYCEMLLSRD